MRSSILTNSNSGGRPVHVTSISFPSLNSGWENILSLIDAEGARGTDIIVLPETWRSQDGPPETLQGPTLTAVSALAQKHRTYIVCPIDRIQDHQRLNSAVLLDRSGTVAGIYDKVYPYWSEFDLNPSVGVAGSVPVFHTDFGCIGLAICFDVNFPEVWKQLADQGAELILWPSAYSAGRSLQAHATNHHFYIVTSTQTKDCIIYDITGEEILYERDDELNITRATLDLDRGIYHENFNIEKRDRLLADHADEVEMEQWLRREQWFVLKAKAPGVRARDLAKQYGLEELRHYVSRSRREIDRMRSEPSGNITTRLSTNTQEVMNQR